MPVSGWVTPRKGDGERRGARGAAAANKGTPSVKFALSGTGNKKRKRVVSSSTTRSAAAAAAGASSSLPRGPEGSGASRAQQCFMLGFVQRSDRFMWGEEDDEKEQTSQAGQNVGGSSVEAAESEVLNDMCAPAASSQEPEPTCDSAAEIALAAAATGEPAAAPSTQSMQPPPLRRGSSAVAPVSHSTHLSLLTRSVSETSLVANSNSKKPVLLVELYPTSWRICSNNSSKIIRGGKKLSNLQYSRAAREVLLCIDTGRFPSCLIWALKDVDTSNGYVPVDIVDCRGGDRATSLDPKHGPLPRVSSHGILKRLPTSATPMTSVASASNNATSKPSPSKVSAPETPASDRSSTEQKLTPSTTVTATPAQSGGEGGEREAASSTPGKEIKAEKSSAPESAAAAVKEEETTQTPSTPKGLSSGEVAPTAANCGAVAANTKPAETAEGERGESSSDQPKDATATTPALLTLGPSSVAASTVAAARAKVMGASADHLHPPSLFVRRVPSSISLLTSSVGGASGSSSGSAVPARRVLLKIPTFLLIRDLLNSLTETTLGDAVKRSSSKASSFSTQAQAPEPKKKKKGSSGSSASTGVGTSSANSGLGLRYEGGALAALERGDEPSEISGNVVRALKTKLMRVETAALLALFPENSLNLNPKDVAIQRGGDRGGDGSGDSLSSTIDSISSTTNALRSWHYQRLENTANKTLLEASEQDSESYSFFEPLSKKPLAPKVRMKLVKEQAKLSSAFSGPKGGWGPSMYARREAHQSYTAATVLRCQLNCLPAPFQSLAAKSAEGEAQVKASLASSNALDHAYSGKAATGPEGNHVRSSSASSSGTSKSKTATQFSGNGLLSSGMSLTSSLLGISPKLRKESKAAALVYGRNSVAGASGTHTLASRGSSSSTAKRGSTSSAEPFASTALGRMLQAGSGGIGGSSVSTSPRRSLHHQGRGSVAAVATVSSLAGGKSTDLESAGRATLHPFSGKAAQSQSRQTTKATKTKGLKAPALFLGIPPHAYDPAVKDSERIAESSRVAIGTRLRPVEVFMASARQFEDRFRTATSESMHRLRVAGAANQDGMGTVGMNLVRNTMMNVHAAPPTAVVQNYIKMKQDALMMGGGGASGAPVAALSLQGQISDFQEQLNKLSGPVMLPVHVIDPSMTTYDELTEDLDSMRKQGEGGGVTRSSSSW